MFEFRSFYQKQSTMEEVLVRFSHIGEKIFNSLDEKSLETCKKVSRTWKNFIEDPNQKKLCIRYIKKLEKNIFIRRYISVQQNWNEFKIDDLGEFAKRLRLVKERLELEQLFLIKYAEFRFELNGKDKHSYNLLHFLSTPTYGQYGKDINYSIPEKFNIAKILVEKCVELNYDINARTDFGYTAFHFACKEDNVKLAEIMIGK